MIYVPFKTATDLQQSLLRDQNIGKRVLLLTAFDRSERRGRTYTKPCVENGDNFVVIGASIRVITESDVLDVRARSMGELLQSRYFGRYEKPYGPTSVDIPIEQHVAAANHLLSGHSTEFRFTIRGALS